MPSTSSQHATPQELEARLRQTALQAENQYRQASREDKGLMLELFLNALRDLMQFEVYGESRREGYSQKASSATASDGSPRFLQSA
jgi:hypothetical protein